ncbi:MAG TPA: hypothetical protein VGG36_01485 [Rhizomicrobium sp.]|jgi:hypothetical protein
MSRVFLHLGAHKTATTFIQANFIANRAALEAQGWKLLHPESDNRAVRNCFLEMRKGHVLPADAQKRLDDFFASIRAGSENFFLSSEAILGAMSVKGSNGRIYPNHAAMLKIVTEALRNKDVAVGFCVRNFPDYLESSYSWLVMRGATYDFQRYVRDVFVAKLTWLPIVENMIETLGEERVHLWTYEDFKTNPAGSVIAIMNAATIDSSNLAIAVKEPRNVSVPPDTNPVAVLWNKVLKTRNTLPKKRQQALRMEMQKTLAKVSRPAGMKRLLSKERRAELTASYEKEIAIMRERWPKAMATLPRDLSES